MEKGRKTYCEKSSNAASKKPSENRFAGNECRKGAREAQSYAREVLRRCAEGEDQSVNAHPSILGTFGNSRGRALTSKVNYLTQRNTT
jgi:hypothetical protein